MSKILSAAKIAGLNIPADTQGPVEAGFGWHFPVSITFVSRSTRLPANA